MSAIQVPHESHESHGLSIRSFYAQKCIFITGATGLLGKFLVYKLLKSCEVDKIYFLLRAKKGSSFAERYNDYLNEEIFTFLPNNGVLEKLVPLEGDIRFSDLGLGLKDYSTLVDCVNVVFHCAASIRLNEPLMNASILHIFGTQSVLKLCKEAKHLDILVHVSSISVFFPMKHLGETVHPFYGSPKQFLFKILNMKEEQVDQFSGNILGKSPKYPNTYSFTKTMAEVLLKEEGGDINIAIVRPPYLYSAYQEPQSGWFDYPAVGSAYGTLFSTGVIRTLNCHLDCAINFLPVDVCVNGMLAIGSFSGRAQTPALSVFNMAPDKENNFSFEEAINVFSNLGSKYPSIRQLRPPKKASRNQMNTIYRGVYLFFAHTLFAYFIDLVLIISGGKPRLVEIMKTLSKAGAEIEKVWCRDFVPDVDNMKALYKESGPFLEDERRLFHYNLKEIDWTKLITDHHLRFRRHVLKEPDSNLPLAVKRMKIVSMVYTLFKISSLATCCAAVLASGYFCLNLM